MYVMEIKLKPLSELLFRQMAKSNVEWFTYPFIPPTTMSGFIGELVGGESLISKKYVEINDGRFRTLPEGVYSLGGIPEIYEKNKHFRQHYRAKGTYNYESLVWEGNKKLAQVEYFYSSKILAYLISENKEVLKRIEDKIKYKCNNIGKIGVVKIRNTKVKKLKKEEEYEGEVSTLFPVEIAKKYDLNKMYEVPLFCYSSSEDETINWGVIPCSFHEEIRDDCYQVDDIIIPKSLIDYVKK
ncbi:hypothetical protein [Sporohalobacter salinus]|uniref:hypothetical protein n=1 Tax=Sporohalobacter salinus TaxID=1494606 RepID=UPI001961FCBD|nr:hypothetical protein [Sporohalobacter salinus]MBM7623684.1 CRISPR/Cas system-associated protein Cas5 (RAMP superfamily) [Sporohalobacter salinus]